MAVFGKSIPLKDFPEDQRIKGIGLSHEPLYAGTLAKKLNYLNTFFHRDPYFDITDATCGEDCSLDFIIATEVFEHIPPTIQPAFDNLARLLKPNGFIIFSTPWKTEGDTSEYFPNLDRWILARLGEDWIVFNRTKAGAYEIFDAPIFHGGQGQTLEMRLFSRSSLERHFTSAGLLPEFPSQAYLDYGIIFKKPWSLPCIVRNDIKQK